MTTGAGNDLERATELARKMVCEWGMSDAMGPLTFGKKEEQIFLGREIAQHQDYSEDTAIRIDQEVKRFVTDNYERAHGDARRRTSARLERMAEELLRAKCSTPSRCAASSPACRSRSTGPSRPASRRPSPAEESGALARPASADRAAAQQALPAGIGRSQAACSRIAGCRTGAPLSLRRSLSVTPRPRFRIPLPGRSPLVLGERTLVMGVLNVTPDSFADGGRYVGPGARRRGGARMVADGADILDVGGESTRPGARRCRPTRSWPRCCRSSGAGCRPCRVPSPSTPTRPTSRAAALDRGAAIVNDISGLAVSIRRWRRSWRPPAPRSC